MGIKSFLRKHINCTQIKALLWKDVLMRIRQPWMTAIQFIWPCVIFLALYSLRLKFGVEDIADCQFPTRQLPTKSGLLPFFQSYICTIENKCSSTKNYEEISSFENAPITPVINIVQTFLNEEKLYNAIVDLPTTANFLGTITSVATHPRFSVLQDNVEILLAKLNLNGSPIDGDFDINQLWSDDMTFTKSGNVFCGKPFPVSNNIRLVDRVFYQEDFNGGNPDELDAMPTKYCKQLYLDVTNTNNGKITWNYIKPIIQGKFLYGPVNAQTQWIMKNTNDTLVGMDRLKNFTIGLDKTIKQLRVKGTFQDKFLNILKLAKSPFVQMMIANFGIDSKILDTIFDALLYDQQVSDIVGTIANIFECFSVDRFIGVGSESELENVAIELNRKRLFFAGIYFGNEGHGSGPNKDKYSYKLRMDADNTPVTLENRNRFWFPGPDGNFELQMRYHRGFIQLQHMIDQGITKTIVQQQNEFMENEWKKTHPTKKKTTTEIPETTEEPTTTSTDTGDNEGQETTPTANESDRKENTTEANASDLDAIESGTNTNPSGSEDKIQDPIITPLETRNKNNNNLIEGDSPKPNISPSQNVTTQSIPTTEQQPFDKTVEDFLEFRDERPNQSATASENPVSDTDADVKTRVKRAPQFDFISSLFDGSGKADSPKKFDGGIKTEDFQAYTKQFPYPEYRRDDFVTGLYLAQAIQLTFFFALIVQVSNAVRSRIWMRESGNSTLMRIMGLEKSAEYTAWILTTFIEMALIFLLCETMLYSGGILQTTSPSLLYLFLLLFGACVIAFCYMMSTFFTSASIGSVATVIFFLMTYMPYIVIIALGTTLSSYSKVIASLSISTAFCYAWRYIMRLELQQGVLNFSNCFAGSFETNEFKFGITMIFIDLILYAIIGYLYERFTNDEFKFHEVQKKDMDVGIGGALQKCTKKYLGSEKAAIDNVSILFRRDFITCLLGRNGAGKSTIIKLLTGQIAPTSGHVFWPQNWDRITGHEYEERVGLCPQSNILIPNLTAREHLELYVRIKTYRQRGRQEVDRVMRSLQFGKHEHFYSQHLSGGFKRRLNVAIAFISSPNLVILDEPCSGVDMKARKNIWDLISVLRKGRAVVLATHYLDEAEHLSDSILIMNEGKVVAEHDPDSLKENFTRAFNLHIQLYEVNKAKTTEAIKALLQEHAPNCKILDGTSDPLNVNVPYRSADASEVMNYSPLIKHIEEMERDKLIQNFRIVSSNLEQIFNDLVVPSSKQVFTNGTMHMKDDEKQIIQIVQREKLSEFEVMKHLLKKRFLHFKRNYRLILCVLVLPTIFEIIAMAFMTLRPPGEHDVNLKFSRQLYSNSTDFYGIEQGDEIEERMYSNLQPRCESHKLDEFGNNCQTFNSSESAFRWILNTTHEYAESRYGGITLNSSRSAVWFNNKGYHAMPVFLNELSTAHLRSLMNNLDYEITTNNHPLKLGENELSVSSILQQVADAGIAMILLIAFSLVVAGSSVYIVNERLSGEKLQQKLCGVSFKTYWGVSFGWDFIIYLIALLLAIVVFKMFDIPAYTAKDNLYGICVLLLLFGFASIPMVHLFEKLFNDASLANMHMLCMNIIIALMTVMVIVLFDVLGESDESEKIRNFLNRAFLVLPQHAFADGLVEICKNHILAEVFERYYINTYKSPVSSTLLLPHFSALICVGIIFIVINYIIESGIWRSWTSRSKRNNIDHDLEAITTVHQNGAVSSSDKKPLDLFSKIGGSQQEVALKVDSLSKTYNRNNQALKDVTFNVNSGECFGLLGANGAGKSTIFGILSGELAPTSGIVTILNRKEGIAYCPQTNALDNLLTVEEIIQFYGKLRRIQNIHEIAEQTLEFFHLSPYRNVLVKNLSGGNRRKLSVAVTCFGTSSNVLMDEPTSDMDPVTRSIVYSSISRLLLDKRSVILTSHTITEIDRVCDRIGILRQGQMISCAPPQQLKTMYGNRYAITVYYDDIEALTIERDIKKTISGIEDLIVHNHCLQFRIKISNPSSVSTNGNINNNENDLIVSTTAVNGDGTVFSDLLNKLHSLTICRGIIFTITECLLDQAFERVLDADTSLHSYENSAYSQSETPT